MKKLLFIFLLMLSTQVIATTYRSPTQVAKFKKLYPCPSTLIISGKCTGIVDHICALANGGIDNPINMQWQSYTDSKKKDLTENTPEGRKLWCNATNSTPTRQVFNKPQR